MHSSNSELAAELVAPKEAPQTVVLAALKRGVRTGSFEVIEADGTVLSFGENVDDMKVPRKAVFRVNDSRFWLRVYRSLFIRSTVSEAFMAQEIDSPDLKLVLQVCIDNLSNVHAGVSSVYSRVFKALHFVGHMLSHSHAQTYGVAGYDASNDLYTAFLSSEMQYSCPSSRPTRAMSVAILTGTARLEAGGRLLEIGSGWGSIAIAKQLAEKRIAAAGFSDQIRVQFMDYRDMPPEFEKAFDACVSLEMLAAVGTEYLPTYAAKIDWALKSKNSAVVLTATTYPERYQTSYQGRNFIRKYHWPHTVLSSALSLADCFNKTLQGRFCIDSIEDFAIHYPRCLREWGRRLDEKWDGPLIDSLQSRYPELKDPHRLEMFRRRWHYMFIYMEVAYSQNLLSCVCWTFARPGFVAETCA
ncbi:unnamed protein product [Mycena citricolor]|uniref:Cyclopropane-fatty-acyl-phospholipid synthase n=1 Tax=Mycena citricolor TaxID=2018698 RepID=A0AAD2JU04_9AGAR|nr:unnamed protein product [Mycena citricolor]